MKRYAHLHRLGSAPPTLDAPGVVSIDVAGDQEPWVDLRGSAPDHAPFVGISWSTMPDVIADACWSVTQFVVWPFTSPRPRGELTPGIKQVSLVRRRPDQDVADFRARYLGHGDVAEAHHGMWQYAQNVDLEPIYGVESDDERFDGISELWFATRDDWRERFYLHDDSQQAVADDTVQFLDYSGVRSALVDEYVAASAPDTVS